MATITINWAKTVTGSWATGNIVTLPVGWRPLADMRYPLAGRDNANSKDLTIGADGRIRYANQGGTQGGYGFAVSCTFPLA